MKKWFVFLLFFTPQLADCQAVTSPEKAIKRIFYSYAKHYEGADSKENEALMEQSLKMLEKKPNPKIIPLLLKIWYGYDPTDFLTRELVENVLVKMKKPSIAQIDKEIIKLKKQKQVSIIRELEGLREFLVKTP